MKNKRFCRYYDHLRRDAAGNMDFSFQLSGFGPVQSWQTALNFHLQQTNIHIFMNFQCFPIEFNGKLQIEITNFPKSPLSKTLQHFERDFFDRLTFEPDKNGKIWLCIEFFHQDYSKTLKIFKIASKSNDVTIIWAKVNHERSGFWPFLHIKLLIFTWIQLMTENLKYIFFSYWCLC